MKLRKITSLILAAALTVTTLIGCGEKSGAESTASESTSETAKAGDAKAEDKAEATEAAESTERAPEDIADYDMFIAMYGAEINDGNEIREMIAEKTGVRVHETWLTGQTAAEAVGTIIASGDLPELIDGGDGMQALYEAGSLIAWDDYIDKYPNLKEMYSDEEWDRFRQDDGKIYWANIFCNTYGENTATIHNDEAFWIQARVLEWAKYPKIETLDDYFKVIEDYMAANPTMEDGTANIPYTCLCEDWRYFCIENAGQFLDGYPNDGSVIVDTANMKIVDYNTTETTKRYFQKLNEEYNKGMVDPEFATQTYDEYIAKLSTGSVLGMCDQWWDFNANVNDAMKQQGLDLKGCNYVPLGLTIESGMEQQWHVYDDTQNIASGVGITTACEDPERVFQFLNDILDQEIHNLRFWGVEGVDYEVDENGLFYRTEEMRKRCADTEYKASHICTYSYLPQWGGTSRDGINAMNPNEQPSEFKSALAEPLVNCLNAYGADNYVDMIGSAKKATGPWYPMYSHSNNMTNDTPGGVAWNRMTAVKHEWLPQVVMASDFDGAWEKYMKAYNDSNPQDFLAEMQEELDRRAGTSK